jgi:hypothetical protein
MSADNYTWAIAEFLSLFATTAFWAIIIGGLSALGVF